jgi:uncharacterized protein
MKFQLFKDKAGEWRWRIVHDNGNIMADSSEGYKNKTDCISAFVSVSIAIVNGATTTMVMTPGSKKVDVTQQVAQLTELELEEEE